MNAPQVEYYSSESPVNAAESYEGECDAHAYRDQQHNDAEDAEPKAAVAGAHDVKRVDAEMGAALEADVEEQDADEEHGAGDAATGVSARVGATRTRAA